MPITQCNCLCHKGPGMITSRNCCGCHIQFTTPDSFGGAEYHHTFEHLITHAQEGIENCFERIEQIEGGFSTFRDGININLDKLQGRIDSQEKQTKALTEMYKNLSLEILGLMDHIDENRKLSKSIDELEKVLRETHEKEKKPYKCPICDGLGYWKSREEGIACGGQCKSCDATGVLWG